MNKEIMTNMIILKGIINNIIFQYENGNENERLKVSLKLSGSHAQVVLKFWPVEEEADEFVAGSPALGDEFSTAHHQLLRVLSHIWRPRLGDKLATRIFDALDKGHAS
jgi:hypothetical protein